MHDHEATQERACQKYNYKPPTVERWVRKYWRALYGDEVPPPSCAQHTQDAHAAPASTHAREEDQPPQHPPPPPDDYRPSRTRYPGKTGPKFRFQDPVVWDALMDGFHRGLPQRDVAALAYVDARSLSRWIRQGDEILERREKEEGEGREMTREERDLSELARQSRAGEARLIRKAMEVVEGAFGPQRHLTFVRDKEGNLDMSSPSKVMVHPADAHAAADLLIKLRPDIFGRRVAEVRHTDHEGKGAPVFELRDLSTMTREQLEAAAQGADALAWAKRTLMERLTESSEPAEG